jgi:hypothetical protein
VRQQRLLWTLERHAREEHGRAPCTCVRLSVQSATITNTQTLHCSHCARHK